MSDRVIVMNHGVVEQSGTPEEVYRWPASEFVAKFLGQSNLLPGYVDGVDGATARIGLDDGPALRTATRSVANGQRVMAVVRAQRIVVVPSGGTPPADAFAGRVASLAYLGGTVAYQINAGRARLQVIAMAGDRLLKEGDAVMLSIQPEDVVLLDERGRRIAA